MNTILELMFWFDYSPLDQARLPEKSRKAMVPVSLRRKDDIDLSNAIGSVSTDLASSSLAWLSLGTKRELLHQNRGDKTLVELNHGRVLQ